MLETSQIPCQWEWMRKLLGSPCPIRWVRARSMAFNRAPRLVWIGTYCLDCWIYHELHARIINTCLTWFRNHTLIFLFPHTPCNNKIQGRYWCYCYNVKKYYHSCPRECISFVFCWCCYTQIWTFTPGCHPARSRQSLELNTNTQESCSVFD